LGRYVFSPGHPPRPSWSLDALVRERLARYIARVQQTLSRAWPWAYPGIIGRFYTSEKAWRIFIPVLGVAYATFGLLWLWKGAY
jgi:hypothetical protein